MLNTNAVSAFLRRRSLRLDAWVREQRCCRRWRRPPSRPWRSCPGRQPAPGSMASCALISYGRAHLWWPWICWSPAMPSAKAAPWWGPSGPHPGGLPQPPVQLRITGKHPASLRTRLISAVAQRLGL